MLVTLALAYAAGSVNFSILLFHLLGRGDPRESFSGNPGVSNVYRQAGPGMAAGVLSLDLLRAAGVALLSVRLCSPDELGWCALALVVGNMFPLFHGFRGGKGVANYLGYTAVVSPWAALLAVWVWLVIFGILRVPFLGSFGMVAVLSLGLAHRGGLSTPALVAVAAVTVLIIAAHRSNLSGMKNPSS
jgi:glycerol-3-phosphate acyltransferase PlsY